MNARMRGTRRSAVAVESAAMTVAALLIVIGGAGCDATGVNSPGLLTGWAAPNPPSNDQDVPLGPEPQILPVTYFRSGQLHEMRGSLELALSQYRKATVLNGKFVAAFNRAGIILDRLGRYEEANEAFLRAIELAPDQAYLRNNLAFSYMLEHRWSDSEAELHNALALSTTFDRARMNLGVTLGRMGRYDEALGQFRQVVPEAAAHYNLGLVYHANHADDEAIESLGKALSLAPRMQAARQQIAVITATRRARQAVRAAEPDHELRGGTPETDGAFVEADTSMMPESMTEPTVVPAAAVEVADSNEPPDVSAGSAIEPVLQSDKPHEPLIRLGPLVAPGVRVMADALVRWDDTMQAAGWEARLALERVQTRIDEQARDSVDDSPGESTELPVEGVDSASADAARVAVREPTIADEVDVAVVPDSRPTPSVETVLPMPVLPESETELSALASRLAAARVRLPLFKLDPMIAPATLAAFDLLGRVDVTLARAGDSGQRFAERWHDVVEVRQKRHAATAAEWRAIAGRAMSLRMVGAAQRARMQQRLVEAEQSREQGTDAWISVLDETLAQRPVMGPFEPAESNFVLIEPPTDTAIEDVLAVETGFVEVSEPPADLVQAVQPDGALTDEPTSVEELVTEPITEAEPAVAVIDAADTSIEEAFVVETEFVGPPEPPVSLALAMQPDDIPTDESTSVEEVVAEPIEELESNDADVPATESVAVAEVDEAIDGTSEDDRRIARRAWTLQIVGAAQRDVRRQVQAELDAAQIQIERFERLLAEIEGAVGLAEPDEAFFESDDLPAAEVVRSEEEPKGPVDDISGK